LIVVRLKTTPLEPDTNTPIADEPAAASAVASNSRSATVTELTAFTVRGMPVGGATTTFAVLENCQVAQSKPPNRERAALTVRVSGYWPAQM
jgi:uncharacterized protein (DUF1786 family)